MMKQKKIFKLSGAVLLSTLLSACAMNANITSAQQYERSIQAWKKIALKEHIDLKKIELKQAVVLSLSQQPKVKFAAEEAKLLDAKQDMAKLDMLPNVILQGEASHRSNQFQQKNISTDGSLITNESSVSPRNLLSGSANVQFNTVDFTNSLINALDLGNDAAIAKESSKIAQNELISSVIQNYYVTWLFSNFLASEDGMLLSKGAFDKRENQYNAVESIINNAQAKRSLNKINNGILGNHEFLINSISGAKALYRQLNGLKDTLLINMGYSPGITKIDSYLVDPKINLPTSKEVANLKYKNLVAIAFANNPVLRGHFYSLDKIEHGKYRHWLDLIPGFNIDLSSNYDSNKYVVNPRWEQSLVSGWFSVTKLFQIPSRVRAWKAEKRMAEYTLHNDMIGTVTEIVTIQQALLDQTEKLHSMVSVLKSLKVRADHCPYKSSKDKFYCAARKVQYQKAVFEDFQLRANVLSAELKLYSALGIPLVEKVMMDGKASIKLTAQDKFSNVINDAYKQVASTPEGVAVVKAPKTVSSK